MIQLRIEYESTVINLQTAGYTVLDGFFPQAASDLNQHMTDAFELWINGATSSDRETLFRALETAFEYARQHPTGIEACYLYFGIDDAATAWRARIFNGAAALDSGMGRRWAQGRVKCFVSVERDAAWEGAETAVTISNPNTPGGTTLGLKIYSCADASGSAPNKRVNYAIIAAAQITGSLPAKCRLEITNTYATNRLYYLWVGHGWNLDFTNLPHLLEAEAGTGGANVSNSSASGGVYRNLTLASGAEATMITWALTATQASALNGHRFRLITRFQGDPPLTTRFRVKQIWQVSEWPTGQKYFDDYSIIAIRDLFTLRMPPWNLQGVNNGGISIALTGQQSTGGNVTIPLDFLALMPADGFRYIACSGYGIAQNERIVDDGFIGDLYADNGSGDSRVGMLVSGGKQIELQPGKDQRLYFYFHSNLANTAEIARTISLKVYYRPRRLAL